MFQRQKCGLPGAPPARHPLSLPISFQSVGTERAVSRTVVATTEFVTSTRGNASATLAGLGTAVMLVRALPSVDDFVLFCFFNHSFL